MRRFASVAAVLMLTGCAEYGAIGEAYGRQAIEYKIHYNDTQRDLFAIGVCETTLGAHIRDPNPQRQMARVCMCGGPCDAKVDLSALLRAIDTAPVVP